MLKVKLGVNIDHVATLRQARGGVFPDPVQAALIAEKAGAQGITAHLREDRRHIQDLDIQNLRKKIKTKLNLEMAATEEMVKIACQILPEDVCLVPEKRKELTTEGGLNVWAQKILLEKKIKQLKKSGICVSLFVDPVEQQIQAAYEIGADAVELHTGTYAAAKNQQQKKIFLKQLNHAAQLACSLNLILNAGHGLDYQNVQPIAKILKMNELNIGFSIIAYSIFVGLDQAVHSMKKLMISA